MPPSPPIKPALKYLDDLLSRTLRSRPAPTAQLPVPHVQAPLPTVSGGSKPPLEALLDKPVSRRKFMDYMKKGAVAASQASRIGGVLGKIPLPEGPVAVTEPLSNLNKFLSRAVDPWFTFNPAEYNLAKKIYDYNDMPQTQIDENYAKDWWTPHNSPEELEKIDRLLGELTEEEIDFFVRAESEEGKDLYHRTKDFMNDKSIEPTTEDEHIMRRLSKKMSLEDYHGIVDSPYNYHSAPDDFYSDISLEFGIED